MRTRLALGILALLPVLLLWSLFHDDHRPAHVEVDEHRVEAPPPPVPPRPLHAPEFETVPVIEQTFRVHEGDHLMVNVPDADLIVTTGDLSVARIEVVVEQATPDQARAFVEAQRLRIDQRDNHIEVEADPHRHGRHFFHGPHHPRLVIKAYIPAVFHANLSTSDGNIQVDALTGDVKLQTSDGDIQVRDLSGPTLSLRTSDGNVQATQLRGDQVSVHTSDGDVEIGSVASEAMHIRTSDGSIRARTVHGAGDLITSDGDVRLDDVQGPRFMVRTSDGEIAIRTLVTEEGRVQTSNGDILLEHLSGNVTATTSDGTIRTALVHPGSVQLHSSSGDVLILAPTSLDARFTLMGESFAIDAAFSSYVTDEAQDDHRTLRLNDGSAEIVARASDGRIALRQP